MSKRNGDTRQSSRSHTRRLAMSTEQTTADQLKERELKAANELADETNKARAGVGTRVRVGQTRGKASQVISWEAFDESKPDTLPTSIQNFMDVTNQKDQNTLLSYLISGYNDSMYTAASDPIAEFVDATWPEDAQAQFRLVVRNYSRGANVSIEDAVKLIKPGFVTTYS